MAGSPGQRASSAGLIGLSRSFSSLFILTGAIETTGLSGRLVAMERRNKVRGSHLTEPGKGV